jgi:hypothetical protein
LHKNVCEGICKKKKHASCKHTSTNGCGTPCPRCTQGASIAFIEAVQSLNQIHVPTHNSQEKQLSTFLRARPEYDGLVIPKDQYEQQRAEEVAQAQ